MKIRRSIGLLGLLVVAAGCTQQPPDVISVQGMNVNDYVFDYPMSLRSPTGIQADSEDVRINAGKNQIEVAKGKLRVDGKSYGPVKPKDRITIEGDQVKVNGAVRMRAE